MNALCLWHRMTIMILSVLELSKFGLQNYNFEREILQKRVALQALVLPS
jgi:hypothetical protein